MKSTTKKQIKIRDIEKYMSGLEKETSIQRYKPFFTIYAKQRHWLNPFKYILGEYKLKWFKEGKQPKNYKNAFELFTESIDLDVKDISIQKRTP